MHTPASRAIHSPGAQLAGVILLAGAGRFPSTSGGGGHIGVRDKARGFRVTRGCDQPDARLVQLARDGDERAFEVLVERYRAPLARYCARFSLTHARGEDVLQQAFLNAWLSLRAGAEVHELRPWLYRIVHNTALNAIRSERARGESLALDNLPAEQELIVARRRSGSDLDDALAARDVLAGIAALPDTQREVLVRAALRGDSYEEVAGALGLTDGAVRGALHRARASLRATVAALTPPPTVISALLALRRLTGAGGGGGADAGAGTGLATLATRGSLAALAAGAAIAGASLASTQHHASQRFPTPHHDSEPSGSGAHAGAPATVPAGSPATIKLSPTRTASHRHAPTHANSGPAAQRHTTTVSSTPVSGEAPSTPASGGSEQASTRSSASTPSQASAPAESGSGGQGAAAVTSVTSGTSSRSGSASSSSSGSGSQVSTSASGPGVSASAGASSGSASVSASTPVASVEASATPSSGSVGTSVSTPLGSVETKVEASTGTVSATLTPPQGAPTGVEVSVPKTVEGVSGTVSQTVGGVTGTLSKTVEGTTGLVGGLLGH